MIKYTKYTCQCMKCGKQFELPKAPDEMYTIGQVVKLTMEDCVKSRIVKISKSLINGLVCYFVWVKNILQFLDF